MSGAGKRAKDTRCSSRNPDVVHCNGIDPDTGLPALPPLPIAELVEAMRRPSRDEHVEKHFAPPYGVDLSSFEEAGWGVVFTEDTPPETREALAPLVARRRGQVGEALFKEITWRKGEQVRHFLRRHQVSAGNLEPESLPYYLLLVGPPTGIPFDFQYLLGIEYAVGRVSFERAADYARYAQSVVLHETEAAAKASREILYWGPRHPGDAATNLSSDLLLGPLLHGLPDGPARQRKPVHVEAGWDARMHLGDEATREALRGALRGDKVPAVVFTAGHGMAIKNGEPRQVSEQGALICADWPGYGALRSEHYLSAADLPEDASLGGTIAFLFACFGAGTPTVDQFLMNLKSAPAAPGLAPQPFVAALPQALLSHPRGGALAVVGHVDRAWGFSIAPAGMKAPQIATFRHALRSLLEGQPVGYAMSSFGQRYAALSTELLTAISPTAPAEARLTDRELVMRWLERNDAQNYVVLGDPAARVRLD